MTLTDIADSQHGHRVRNWINKMTLQKVSMARGKNEICRIILGYTDTVENQYDKGQKKQISRRIMTDKAESQHGHRVTNGIYRMVELGYSDTVESQHGKE